MNVQIKLDQDFDMENVEALTAKMHECFTALCNVVTDTGTTIIASFTVEIAPADVFYLTEAADAAEHLAVKQ